MGGKIPNKVWSKVYTLIYSLATRKVAHFCLTWQHESLRDDCWAEAKAMLTEQSDGRGGGFLAFPPNINKEPSRQDLYEVYKIFVKVVGKTVLYLDRFYFPHEGIPPFKIIADQFFEAQISP
jgi:hypothetical protein